MPKQSLTRIIPIATVLFFCALGNVDAQTGPTYTRADSLRGSLDSPARNWWDVVFYDLHVAINPADSTIHGHNAITYRVLETSREMQIDLQEPLLVDSMVQDGESLPFRRDGNAYFVSPSSPQSPQSFQTLTVYYGGRPHVARRPPWDGGFTWAR